MVPIEADVAVSVHVNTPVFDGVPEIVWVIPAFNVPTDAALFNVNPVGKLDAVIVLTGRDSPTTPHTPTVIVDIEAFRSSGKVALLV
jgi:hypothetical protein